MTADITMVGTVFLLDDERNFAARLAPRILARLIAN
jgi:hypothetical protein